VKENGLHANVFISFSGRNSAVGSLTVLNASCLSEQVSY